MTPVLPGERPYIMLPMPGVPHPKTSQYTKHSETCPAFLIIDK